MVFMAIITIWLLGMSIMDIRSLRVPVWMIGAGAACILAVLAYRCGRDAGEYGDILRGMVPGVLLLAYGAVTKKSGYGDGIVMTLLGMVLREGRVFLLFGISLFLISAWALLLLAMKKGKPSTRIPYLPFLAAAWILIAK